MRQEVSLSYRAASERGRPVGLQILPFWHLREMEGEGDAHLPRLLWGRNAADVASSSWSIPPSPLGRRGNEGEGEGAPYEEEREEREEKRRFTLTFGAGWAAGKKRRGGGEGERAEGGIGPRWLDMA